MSAPTENMTRRRFVELLVAAGVATTGTVALGGCTQGGDAEDGQGQKPDEASAADAKTTERPAAVTDAKGREVAVPEKIERIGITCMGGALQTMSVLDVYKRQDAVSMDVQRLRECSMMVTVPDGRAIPFCSYHLTDAAGKRVYPPWGKEELR